MYYIVGLFIYNVHPSAIHHIKHKRKLGEGGGDISSARIMTRVDMYL
jgi:hypothetical protein